MKRTDESHDSSADLGVLRWQRFLAQTTLTFAGMCSGLVLYLALFPSFYYMTWVVFVVMLWGVVALAAILQSLALLALVTGEKRIFYTG